MFNLLYEKGYDRMMEFGRGLRRSRRHRNRQKENQTMNRIKNSLIAFACLSALIAIIAVLTPRSTQGQAGSTTSKEVSVVNTPTVNVANSPAVRAQQGGNWTVNLAEGASVGIDPARNKVKVDDSTREPVTISLGLFHVAGQQTYVTDTFLVPEGKRLVVEHVYGNVVRVGNAPAEFFLRTVVPGHGAELNLPLSYTTTTWPLSGEIYTFCFTQPVKLYVANPTDDGKEWGIDVFSIDHGGTARPVLVSGYLEPLP